MGVRRQARELALQAIFMCDFLDSWSPETVSSCLEHFQAPEPAREYAEKLAGGVIANLTRIDSKLTSASEQWSVSRMARCDRSVLRIAVFEILFSTDIPYSVAINEAIEIAKRFGSSDSPKFINGVLDGVAKEVKNFDDDPELKQRAVGEV